MADADLTAQTAKQSEDMERRRVAQHIGDAQGSPDWPSLREILQAHAVMCCRMYREQSVQYLLELAADRAITSIKQGV